MGVVKNAKMSSKKGISKSSKTKKAKSGDYQKGRELPVQPKAELKCLDVAQQVLTFNKTTTPPTFQLLNAVVNGAEIYQRTGRKIYMKSIHLKGAIYPTNGTPSTSMGALRLIVFFDAQPNAAAPTIATLLKDANAAAGTSQFSELNLDNRERFTILREKIFVMGQSTTVTNIGQAVAQDGTQCLHLNEFIKLKRIEALFNATNGGTIADVTSGAIFIVALSDSVMADGSWFLSYSSRLRYYD